jgi:hypothetical protein
MVGTDDQPIGCRVVGVMVKKMAATIAGGYSEPITGCGHVSAGCVNQAVVEQTVVGSG